MTLEVYISLSQIFIEKKFVIFDQMHLCGVVKNMHAPVHANYHKHCSNEILIVLEPCKVAIKQSTLEKHKSHLTLPIHYMLQLIISLPTCLPSEFYF